MPQFTIQNGLRAGLCSRSTSRLSSDEGAALTSRSTTPASRGTTRGSTGRPTSGRCRISAARMARSSTVVRCRGRRCCTTATSWRLAVSSRCTARAGWRERHAHDLRRANRRTDRTPAARGFGLAGAGRRGRSLRRPRFRRGAPGLHSSPVVSERAWPPERGGIRPGAAPRVRARRDCSPRCRRSNGRCFCSGRRERRDSCRAPPGPVPGRCRTSK